MFVESHANLRPDLILARDCSERQFQDAFLEFAGLLGWRRLHIRVARTATSWRTPVQGDGAGFPDNLLLRRDRGIVAELKSVGGRMTDRQQEWIAAFLAAGFEAYCWTPLDLEEIAAVLA